ncbi:MAG: chorismate--pyruvate lyase family protein [Solirubrobacteraceae bacterium]
MVADRLAERHFTAQSDGSGYLEDLDIRSLDPFLRGLLFTDGTVSRALEAHTLLPVAVEPVEQAPAAAPEPMARHLEVSQGQDCLRRRVVMRIAGPGPSVWAESYVVPERLPPQFLPALGGDSQGIGGSLQQLRLESARELLWFGLGEPPGWWSEPTPATRTLTRCYLIITGGRPALLITEAFALEQEAQAYRLLGSNGFAAGGVDQGDEWDAGR